MVVVVVGGGAVVVVVVFISYFLFSRTNESVVDILMNMTRYQSCIFRSDR